MVILALPLGSIRKGFWMPSVTKYYQMSQEAFCQDYQRLITIEFMSWMTCSFSSLKALSIQRICWSHWCFLKANSVPQLPSMPEKQYLILSHSYAKSKQTFSCVSLLLAVLLFTRSSFSCCNLSNVAFKGNTCSFASWKVVGKSSFYFCTLVKINYFSSSKKSNVVIYFFFGCIKKRKCENMY